MYELASLYYTIYLGLKFLLVLMGIWYLNKKGYLRTRKNLSFFYVISILIVCVVAVVGDYWTYYRWYEGFDDEHIEPIWYFLKSIIPNSFDLFRAVIWGSGLYLYVKIFKMYKLNLTLVLCLFSIFYIDYYNYARAAIALVYVVLGFSVLYCETSILKKLLFKIIFFLACVAVGIAMHRSMILVLPALICALFVRVTRKTVIVLILLFPVLSFLINQVSDYVVILLYGSDFLGDAASAYFTFDDNQNTIFSVLIQRLPTLAFYSVSFYYLLNTEIKNNSINTAGKAAFLIIYIAFLMVTITSVNTMVFFYRALNMAYPFMLITIAYTIRNIKNLRALSLICIAFVLIELLLDIRIFYLHPDFVIKQMNDRFFI